MSIIIDIFVVILVCAALFSLDYDLDYDLNKQCSKPYFFNTPLAQERACCTRAKCIHN